MHVEAARVRDDGGEQHPTLFPMGDVAGARPSPRAVCESIGLNWLSAVQLHKDKWLSFDPAKTTTLTHTQEAELHFLGALAVAGCDAGMLKTLTDELKRPLAYRLDRMYYDWHARQWRLLSRPEEMRERFESWVEEMVDRGDGAGLERLEHSVRAGIRTIRSTLPW